MDTKTDHSLAPTGADAIDMGKRSIEAVAGLTHRNMQAMLAMAEVTTQGVQAVVNDMAAFSKENLERASAATREMTTATSPADIAKLQADFAWAHFDAARSQLMKLSDAMFLTAREQLAAQAALAQREVGIAPATKPTRR